METISAQIRAYEERQKAKGKTVKKCASCGRVLQETVTGNRPTDQGAMCSDCYYNDLGEAIERHPLVSPRAPRG